MQSNSNLILKIGGLEVRRVGSYKFWQIDFLTSKREDPEASLLWRAFQIGHFRVMYWNAYGRIVQRILFREAQ